jgi:hypothetical protein
MQHCKSGYLGLMLAAAVAMPALAQQAPVKIGMVTTLSGPGGYLGQDIRDAFKLAIDMNGGKLGGAPVELVVEDDALKPGQGKQIAEKMLKTDGIKIMTGIVFSNVAGATVPDIVDAGALYVSPNAAPSNFAGKECNENYFVVSWQNDSLHESAPASTPPISATRRPSSSPELPGRQGCARGLQAPVQGRDRRRGLYQARPDRFRPGDGADPLGQSRRRLPVPSGRARHRLLAPIPAGRPARQNPDGAGRTLARRDHAEGGRRRGARPQRHPRTGTPISTTPRTRRSSRPSPKPTTACRPITPARATTPPSPSLRR